MERPSIRRVAANKSNKQSRTADEGWSSSLRVGEVITNLPVKNFVKKHSQRDACSGDKTFRIYRIIILPVVLYGCETWSLTLREERKLRLFENRMLRRIFGSRRDDVMGEWRRLHNEELNDLRGWIQNFPD